MKVLLFGASAMVGGGVLRACLLAPDVVRVVSVGRAALPASDAKLVQAIQPGFAADPAGTTRNPRPTPTASSTTPAEVAR